MPENCQVDFYVLQDESQSAEKLACRLALMAWEKGHRIMVIAETETDATRLDDLMWEYPDNRFLPHSSASQKPPAPVSIGTMDMLNGATSDLVINLTDDPVPDPGRFQRLLELVPARDARRKASREKFRGYRSQGLQPQSHPIN